MMYKIVKVLILGLMFSNVMGMEDGDQTLSPQKISPLQTPKDIIDSWNSEGYMKTYYNAVGKIRDYLDQEYAKYNLESPFLGRATSLKFYKK